MKAVAKFEKVSFERYFEDYLKMCSIDAKDAHIPKIREQYEQIKLPKRGTTGSAGYDFFAPEKIVVPPQSSITVPTGIRCKMEEGYVLMGFPRSGLGFKYRMSLENTVAVIDEDYYYSDNEGHIMIKLHNPKFEPIIVETGKGFAQGIFMEYFVTYDDDTTEIRNGGFGSTTRGK